MSRFAKPLSAILFLLVLVLLGAADAMLNRGKMMLPDLRAELSPPSALPDSGETGVRRRRDPEVFDVLSEELIQTEPAKQQSFLRQVIPSEKEVLVRTLVKNNDRLGLLAFVDSPDVKTYFLAVKDALHRSFSPLVKDVVDETRTPDGRPVYNIVSFYDPSISPDRIVFIRVHQRLYEFHIADGKDADIQRVIEALTT